MNCTICGNSASILYHSLPDRLHSDIPGRYMLKRCSGCGLLFVDPQPSQSELCEHYPADYGVYKPCKPESKSKKIITRLVASTYFGYGKSSLLHKILLFPFYFKLSHLPCYVSNGKLLDLGCGTGTRMLTFKRLGWKVEGLEPDKGAAAIARKTTDCPVYVGTLEDIELPQEHYDAVYMNQVFEHLRDPVLALTKIKNTLKPDGQLIVFVPNSKSFGFRFFRQYWGSLDVPRHLFTYNGDNIRVLLEKFSFKVVRYTYSNTFSDMSSSIAYKLGRRSNTFSYLNRLFWLLGLVADPIFQRLKLADCVTVLAVIKKNGGE